jgi:hypothetical protein
MKTRLLFVLPIAIMMMGCQSVSLRRDPEGLRESFLKERPLGTSMKEIEEWVKSKGWKDVAISYSKGFFRNTPFREATVGVKSITVTLGDYVSFPVGFTTMVVAYWGFNEKGELIDVWVNKSADAP